MVRAVAVLTAVALGSCDFDLASVPRPSGASIDAHLADAPPVDGASDAACQAVTFTAASEADTSLAAPSPDLNFGLSAIANIGTAVGTVGIFRFDVAMLPPTAHIQSVEVVFTFAEKSNQCAMACGSCVGVEHAGTLSLFAMRSDWVETEATWNHASNNSLWAAPGASQAGVDRSVAPVATVTHAPGTSERMQVGAAAFPDLNRLWRQNDRISFELVPSAAAVMIVATRESGADGCTPGGYPIPKLSITYCP